jgi:hypothetical protein
MNNNAKDKNCDLVPRYFGPHAMALGGSKRIWNKRIEDAYKSS